MGGGVRRGGTHGGGVRSGTSGMIHVRGGVRRDTWEVG